MRFLANGRAGLLVECADLDEVIALDRALRTSPPPGVIDVVPAAKTVLLGFEARVTSHARLADAVRALPLGAVCAQAADEVTIAVTYDGADLPEIAALAGLPPAEVVRRHLDATYTVAFAGFSPGFAYLVGGDPALNVPRRTTPRTRVPAGSVALAGEFSGVYPREGPGGWQLLGRTDARIWDLDRDPPALLAPGTRVRFVAMKPVSGDSA